MYTCSNEIESVPLGVENPRASENILVRELLKRKLSLTKDTVSLIEKKNNGTIS